MLLATKCSICDQDTFAFAYDENPVCGKAVCKRIAEQREKILAFQGDNL